MGLFTAWHLRAFNLLYIIYCKSLREDEFYISVSLPTCSEGLVFGFFFPVHGVALVY